MNYQKTLRLEGLPDHVSIPDSMVESSFPKNWDVLSVASLLRKGVIVDLKDGNHGANHQSHQSLLNKELPFIYSLRRWGTMEALTILVLQRFLVNL